MSQRASSCSKGGTLHEVAGRGYRVRLAGPTVGSGPEYLSWSACGAYTFTRSLQFAETSAASLVRSSGCTLAAPAFQFRLVSKMTLFQVAAAEPASVSRRCLALLHARCGQRRSKAGSNAQRQRLLRRKRLARARNGRPNPSGHSTACGAAGCTSDALLPRHDFPNDSFACMRMTRTETRTRGPRISPRTNTKK